MFSPASDVPPQHPALVQHQTLPQRQALRQHQAWQPHLSDAPEHTQAGPEQQDNSSGRRCICRNHLRSSSSCGVSGQGEARGHLWRRQRCCGHAPQLCFLPMGALLSCSLTGTRAVPFQSHGRLDISSPSPELPPSPVRQRAGNFQPTLRG